MTPDNPIVAWRYRHGPDDSWRVTQQRPECEQCESVPLVFQSDLAAAQTHTRELDDALQAACAERDAAQARVKELEESREELRKACAQVLGYNEDAWPAHGNPPLAICAALALRVQRIKELESALTDLLPLAEQSHVGGPDTQALLDAARKALTGDER